MKFLCDCGTELDLLPPRNEKDFMGSRTICPICGQIGVLRLMKGDKIVMGYDY